MIVASENRTMKPRFIAMFPFRPAFCLDAADGPVPWARQDRIAQRHISWSAPTYRGSYDARSILLVRLPVVRGQGPALAGMPGGRCHNTLGGGVYNRMTVATPGGGKPNGRCL